MSSNRRPPILKDELNDGLYKPEYDPIDPILPHSIPSSTTGSEAATVVEKKISGDLPSFADGEIPRPLTREEAEIVMEKKRVLKKEIARTRTRIARIRAEVEQRTKSNDGAELSFSVDISKKGAVRRALKKAFGVQANTLTFEMYKIALEAKHQIEKSEKDAYLDSDFDEDDE